jgi:hypothetical protein
MANLQNDFPDDQPATDSGATNPRPMSAAQHNHFKEIAGHLLDNASAVGHGHAVGSQGERGHKMVANDAHFQKGAYVRQGTFAKAPQNTSSDGAGSANASDPSTSDYGTVDKG